MPAVVLPTGSLGEGGRDSERPLTLCPSMCMLAQMQVYAFTSAFDLTIRAFSRDPTGDNLPAEHAPWRRDDRGHTLTIDPETDPIAGEVRGKGYFVVRVSDQV